MKVKSTTFREHFNTRSYRKVYPRDAQDNVPHLTIERDDLITEGDAIGDVTFTKFHYTETSDDDPTKRIAFEEVGGVWKCARDGKFVPPPLRDVIPRAKAMAKTMIETLAGTYDFTA